MNSLPKFFYGTAWKEEDTTRCVEDAFRTGFRAIDTANQRKHYFEAGVGTALANWIKAGHGKRSDLFIQTKFTSVDGQDQRLPYDPTAPLSTQVEQSFQVSLEHLHTDYLDSYILHGPTSRAGVNSGDREIWSAMEKLADSGKVKHLGVSNVSLEQLKIFFDIARVKPTFVQNRCYARTGWDREIREFCAANAIRYQGFSLLTANTPIFKEPEFTEIVKRTQCTPAQVVFRFAEKVGMIPLTGTTDPRHMAEDLESPRCALTEEDVRCLEGIAN